MMVFRIDHSGTNYDWSEMGDLFLKFHKGNLCFAFDTTKERCKETRLPCRTFARHKDEVEISGIRFDLPESLSCFKCQ